MANGANQFLLSIIATIIIITFLITRNIFKNRNNDDGSFSSDSNILTVNIVKNDKIDIDKIIEKLKINFKYLKLKSAHIEKINSNYVFWYEAKDANTTTFLKSITNLSNENVSISIYSKSGAFE